jgi:sugar phosphate isomerase/epimerase
MNRRDFLTMAIGTGSTLSMGFAADSKTSANLGLLLYSYGIRSRVERDQGFANPIPFLSFAQQRGAVAVQVPIGIRTREEATEIRRFCDRSGMIIEGIISPPKNIVEEFDRFSPEMNTLEECGVTVARVVVSSGRRYEVFDKRSEFVNFLRQAEDLLKRIDGLAHRNKVVLAVENHKDFRIDEMVTLLKRVSSEWIGVCLDTGNNLSLLDDPYECVEALAPYTRTVHLKDIAVEESKDGFLMSEVPLGQGMFDLPRMVSLVHQKNPKARFHLEMITRDPLSIPCLTEKYWSTMGQVVGSDLARTLTNVRAKLGTEPLPRMTRLSEQDQLAAEEKHVLESFAYAAKTGLIPPSH